MKKKVIAIVPAAGVGKRFGRRNNKTFQMLQGKPIVIWTLEVFESVDDIVEVIPVFKKDDMEQGCDLVERFKLSKVKRIAHGGKERQDSVYNGLNLIGNKASIVLIHDGVRPLIEKSTIEGSIRQLKDFDGVAVGVPLKDTIKEVRCHNAVGATLSEDPHREVTSSEKEIIIRKTLDRNVLWAVQTPQVFKYASLMKAYKKAMAEGFYSTDDAAIVEKYGGRVKVIMGSYANIKITTPEDMDITEMFLRKRKSRV